MKYLLVTIVLGLSFHGLGMYPRQITPSYKYQDNTKTFKGSIVQSPFVNSSGREVKNKYVYHFESKSKTYSINLHESSVTEAEMKQVLKKKLKVGALIKNGDAGQYMVLIKIL